MSKRSCPLLAVICLLAFSNFRVDAAEATSLIAALFDESIVAGNVTAVRQRSALLDDDERLESLIRWVLPSKNHGTIRMQGDFTQTNPSPVRKIDSTPEHAAGGRIVSPVFDLLDLAERKNRLPEILDIVVAIPEPGPEEQKRAKAALLTLLHLELGNTDESTPSIDRLSQLVRTSGADEMSDMWPETLVVYRSVVRRLPAPGIDDVLAYLFSQRTHAMFL